MYACGNVFGRGYFARVAMIFGHWTRVGGGHAEAGRRAPDPFAIREVTVRDDTFEEENQTRDGSSPPTDKEMWKKRAILNISNLKISGGRRGETEKSLQSKTAQAHKGVPLSRLDGARTHHVRTERCYEQGVGPHRNFLHPSSFSKYAEMNRASRDRTRALSSSTF